MNLLFYVVEFPLYEYNEEDQRYVAAHRPFTAPVDEDLPLLIPSRKNEYKAYDIVLNGVELGGEVFVFIPKKYRIKCFKHLVLPKKRRMKNSDFCSTHSNAEHRRMVELLGLDEMLMLMLKRDSIRQ